MMNSIPLRLFVFDAVLYLSRRELRGIEPDNRQFIP